MGRRRKRRLHARSAGSQPPPPETRAASSAGGDPRSDGAGSSTVVVGRCSKRPGVADSVPTDRDKRRKLENDDNAVKDDDGETTEEDEQNATTTTTVGVDRNDRNGSGGAEVDPVKPDLDGTDRNGSDPVDDDPVKTDEDGSNRVGSVENGDGGEGVPGDPWSLLSQGDPETSIVVTCGKNEGRLYLYKLRVVVSERCRSKCIRTGNTWWTPNEFQFVSGRGAAKDWKRTVKHAGRCLKALLASGTLCLSSTPPRCLCDSCTAQGCGKTADESDDIGRNINAGGDDLSNGKPVQDASNIRNKGIKRRPPIKRHIKGADATVPPLGDGSAEPVSVPSKKRRKLVRNAKPEAHSDSTVSLSADVIFESGSGEAEVGGAKSSDVSRTVEAPVPVLPPPPPLLVGERKRGRPKKKTRAGVAPSKKPSDGGGKTEAKVKAKVKVAAEKDSISGQSVPLIDGCCPVDEVAPPPSSELPPQESPDGQRRTGTAEEDGSALPENRSTRLNDIATAIPPPPPTASASRSPPSPEEPEAAAAAATDETTSKNDALHLPLPLPRDPSSQPNSISIVVNQSPETDAPPFAGKVEQENVVDVVTVVETSTTDHGASDPLPVCPSGDAHAPDGAEADPRRTEDEVTVGGDVKDDVKTGSSPVLRDDVVTETPLAEPRRKNAYLNAVIAELKRKKISRETSVTNISSTGTKDHHHHHHHQQQQQHHQHQQHQRTRHPSDQQPTTVSLIKSEPSPESKSISDALIRDIRSPLSGLTSPSSSSFCSSDPPLAFVPTSNSVAGKPLSCLKTLPVDTDRKDVAPYPDVRSGSGTRRTDWRTTSAPRGTPLSTPDFPYGEAAFWRHLPSMVGAPEGKAGGGGGGGGKQQPGVGGRAADMSSPLSMSQLASICGLSQSQLASLPFPPPQFSLYPPYLFMGFPLQPLLPEFQSGSHPTSPAAAAGGAASTTATTGGHPSIQRPPSHPLPPSASSSTSASAPSNAPSSHQHHQQQQQQPRRRRSHHHHHCKSSSSSAASSASGPPKDPLFRHPPADPHHAASYSALRKTDSTPTNQSAALLSELSRWRSCAPGLSSQPWTGTTTKSNSPNRFGPTGTDVQERKLWRPAAAIASSAKEYSPAAYESSIVPSRSSAHAPAKECAVTCRSYGDTSLAAHAHRFDSLAPVDFTRRFRARDEVEERKYVTGSGEYPCDEQGVLDLSKK